MPSFKEIGAMAALVREADLTLVLAQHGCTRDPRDKKKWHTPRGVLSLNGQKFMNWATGIGGGGAIDLVIHLQAVSFKDAVLWLNNTIPEAPAEVSCRNRLRLPTKDDTKLSRVIRYLRHKRSLPDELIHRLIQSGKLYADSKANAVFLLLGKKKSPVGAELCGTSGPRWKGMAPGSIKSKGCFYIIGTYPRKMILCESAIDAASCFVLHPEYTTASTSGAIADPGWIQPLITKGYEMYCGFDHDQTGNLLSEKMIQLYPSIKRLQPSEKDWNEVLLKSRFQTRNQETYSS